MRMILRLLFLLGVIIGTLYAAATRKQSNLPAWVDCTSNLDCAPGYCCTISFEKYSYPYCRRLQMEGEFCRPGGPLTTNGSRYYPDNTEIVLEDVYLMFCPCHIGFVCDRDDGVCSNASEMKDFNHLGAQSSKRDD